jgi:hypothetical protein
VGIDVASLLTSFGALGVVVLLLLTGILVTGWAYRKLEAENHTYRNALQVERQHPGSHKPCRRVPDGGLKRVPPELRRFVEDGDFIAAHWTPGEDGCTCHMFDPATNLCTAQHSTGQEAASVLGLSVVQRPADAGTRGTPAAWVFVPHRRRAGAPARWRRPLIPVTVL